MLSFEKAFKIVLNSAYLLGTERVALAAPGLNRYSCSPIG